MAFYPLFSPFRYQSRPQFINTKHLHTRCRKSKHAEKRQARTHRHFHTWLKSILIKSVPCPAQTEREATRKSSKLSRCGQDSVTRGHRQHHSKQKTWSKSVRREPLPQLQRSYLWTASGKWTMMFQQRCSSPRSKQQMQPLVPALYRTTLTSNQPAVLDLFSSSWNVSQQPLGEAGIHPRQYASACLHLEAI